MKIDSILKLCNFEDFESHPSVLKLSDLGIELSIKNNDTLSIIQFNLIKSRIYKSYGKTKKALEKSNEALLLSKKIGNSFGLKRSYSILGSVHQGMGNYDLARSMYNKSLNVSDSINDIWATWFALNNIATSYQRQGFYQKSLPLLDSIISNPYLKDYLKIQTIANKAIAFNNLGKPAEALKLFLKVKDFANSKEDFRKVAKVDHHIGYLLEKNSLYNDAIRYYESAQNYFSSIKNKEQADYLNLSLANLNFKIGYLNKAKNLYEKVFKSFTENRIKRVGYAEIGLGNVAFEKDNYQKARQYYNDALQSFKKENNAKGIPTAKLKLAEISFQKKDYKTSLEFAEESLSEFKVLKLNDELIETYNLLSKLYGILGNKSLLEENSKELNILIAATKGPEIIASTSKYLIQDVLNTNEKDNAQISLDIQKYNSITLVVFLLFLIFSIIVILLFYQKKRSQYSSTKEKNVERTINLKEQEAKFLIDKLNVIIDEEQLYVKPDITLTDLSKAIKTTDKKLSELLNYYLNTNFYNYINSKRIELFMKKIDDNEYEAYSIFGLAQQCGFKSKTSFYRNFKKEKGFSPKDYIHNLSK
ncbi:AraC family transcriptional regulator [Polaribacter porphyrae]|uniref:AraC family transcriptional regulator n=1 Tax=Polaribacter porphyrae TaxID=1137780 RepID=UPI001475311D|nr:AraC family transcriptional regulator [Polaribacter porphyrae]